ncbi:MAG TPA: hypothetical protein VKE30_06505 [Chthoniobacterales bacterium]|nr:hypothetical protein [Chthoniobacterales bacterium]
MPKKIPPPPPAPLFPPEELIRSVEEVYVEKRRAKMERETIVAPKEVEKFIKDDLKSFERKDVLTKVYPPNDQVIICEGDSWFNHPLLEDLPELLLYFGYSVLHSNYPGKLLKESLKEANFVAPLQDKRKPQIKALLLSGGGNDLINWGRDGAPFSPIFQNVPPTSQPIDFINVGKLEQALAELAGSLKGIAEELARNAAGKLPVLLHCYDFIEPKKYGPSPLKGTWVDKQLDEIKAPPDPEFRKKITGELQQRWIDSYKAVCRELGWQFVVSQQIVKTRWYDEIHPKNEGFYAIARITGTCCTS